MAPPLTFPFRVRAEITDDMSLPGLAVIYGDGHKQRRRNGLVVPKIVWNIDCILNDKTDEFKLETFIRLVGQHTYFLWQSPRDVRPCLYYLTGRVGGSYRIGGGDKKDFFVRSMQFEDANCVVSAPTSILPTPPSNGVFLLRVETVRFYDLYGAAITSSPIFISAGKFGSSVKFGSLDSITIPLKVTPQLIPSTGNWTIDFWFVSEGASNYGTTFSLNNDRNRPLLIFRENQIKLKITYGAGLEIVVSAGDPSFTQFEYYGFQRNGSTLSAWKNGIMISSVPFDPNIIIDAPTTDSVIGTKYNFYANTGNYEEFRISHVAQNLALVPTALFI